MRKITLLGASFLALATSAWSFGAIAQTPPAAATPAPSAMKMAPPAAQSETPMAAPTPAAEPPAPPAAEPPAPAAESAPAKSEEAPAKPMKKKPMMHKMHHKMAEQGKLAPTKAGDKAVEDLNGASLDAAKSGKPFVAPKTPEAAKMDAHEPAKKAMKKPMKMKKKMPKKAASGDGSM